MERDKFLTEAMGKCWHEYKPAKIPYCDSTTETIDSFKCSCGYIYGWCEQSFMNHVYMKNTDFSTWQGFGKLWEWAINQEWWNDFTATFTLDGIQTIWIPKSIIHQERFADVLHEYLIDKP